jgi:hypothetical protein
MRMGLRKFLLAMTLGLGTACLPAAITAADDKKSDKKPEEKKADSKSGDSSKDEKKSLPPGKLPDFSKQFASAGELSGVVVAADEDSVTIRMNYRVAAGGRNAREAYKDVEFKYAEGALARTKVPPTRPDAKGKFVKVPASELEPLKKPQGAPGLHIDRTVIGPGAIVTLELLRPKSIPASKASLDDKVIKFAIVTGETTPPTLTWEEKQKQKEKGEKKEKKP